METCALSAWGIVLIQSAKLHTTFILQSTPHLLWFICFFIDSLNGRTDHLTQYIHLSVSRNTTIELLYSTVQQLWPKKSYKNNSFIWSSQQHFCIFFNILVSKTKQNHSEMFWEMFDMIHKDLSKVLQWSTSENISFGIL